MRGLPCVKGAVSRRLTEGSAKAFLSNRVLSKHPALSIPPSRLRRATSLYAREASSGGGAPSSVPGYARSTFPVGEGFLPAGALYFSPSWTRRGPLHTQPCGGTLGKHRGQGFPPAGAFPYLPLGEGAAAAADEGRYQVGSAYRPTPVRASPCHPLPGEGLAPHPARAAPGPP